MHTSPRLLRFCSRWLGATSLALLAAVPLSAVDVSGLYADGGTPIAGPSDQLSSGDMSLHALLKLEFDAKMSGVLHDQTSHVRIKQLGGQIDIEVFDVNEVLSWSARWIEGRDYVLQGDRLVARFPSSRVDREEIVLVFERLPKNGLLQITTQRLSPTVLGPAARHLHTALFYTMP